MGPRLISARTRGYSSLAAMLALVFVGTSLVLAPSPAFAASGDITEYPVTPGSNVWSVAAGTDGRMWFTENGGNRIGAIDPVTGVVDEYPLPIASLNPYGITAGPDGNMWFSLTWNGLVGRITPSGDITLFPLVSAPGNRRGIAPGPDGKLWLTSSGDVVESVTVSGTPAEYALPPGSFPDEIAAGPDGRMWFAESGSIGAVTVDGNVTHYPLNPAYFAVTGMAAGPDGRMWFTEPVNDVIGTISMTGVVTEFALAPGTNPRQITAGPNNTLWFSGSSSNTINSITTAGVVTRYALPANTRPEGVAVSPDGRMLWFRSGNGNSISSFVLPQPPTITTAALPDGTVGASYTSTIAADGDTPMTFAVTAGSLPAGLALDAASGVISGTPTTVETASFAVTATNSIGSDTAAVSITITAAPAVPPAATAGSGAGTIAATGADWTGPATVGLLLIASGVVMMSLRPRTRRT